MTIYQVGTTPGIATVSDAINAAVDGDTILIQAGTYVEDFPTIRAAITIQGIGGLAHLMPLGQPTNGKATLVVTASVTLDHLELSGAAVPDGNGAGIRYEGGDLVVTNSWIHDNQEGLLAGSSPGGTITIDRSEFNNNGSGTGLTHNLYVNRIARLTVTNSYFHDALGGHEIKSRAETTVISGNRIQDGPDASTSYSIDLPDGGVGTITGNVIEKGSMASNGSLIHFGGEASPSYAGSSLVISGNTVVNDWSQGRPHLLLNQTSDGQGANYSADIANNVIYRIVPADLNVGHAAVGQNTFPGTASPELVTQHPFDIPCYAAGTRISTPEGEIAIEDLRPGMRVLSAFGGTAPVVWVGRCSIDCASHRRPKDVCPVRVRAGTFGPGLPQRDLLLSPDHAVYIDGALIPIRTLINGGKITQEWVKTVTYYHVELPTHDVVFAEGLPAETYLDTGNRSAFENAGTPVGFPMQTVQEIWASNACAPQIRFGPRHDAVANRL